MPYYQYRTEDGDVIEVQQSINDEPLTEMECPHCKGHYTAYPPPMGRAICWHCTEGKVPVVKVYSAPGIVLKGRGFYRTGG